jgi:hypothetical protein
MRRSYSLLLILILASLLTGCGSGASAQSGESKIVENDSPAEQLEKSNPASPVESDVLDHDPPESCAVTTPPDPPFMAPQPYSPDAPFESHFWFGTASLWTMLPRDAIWYGLPYNAGGYTQKVFWWSDLFSWNDEPQPELVVFGERIDAKAPPLKVSRATNASAGDIGTAMLVGVEFPTRGCWKITGQYKKSELSFVVWVAP